MSAGLRGDSPTTGTEVLAPSGRAVIKAAACGDDALDRLIVGMVDKFSEFDPCGGNIPALIAAVQRGVLLKGGLPLRFPTISIHETFVHPIMGTASTMACSAETLGMALPQSARPRPSMLTGSASPSSAGPGS
jgi:dihydroxy-acid dehydratase